MAKKTKGSFSWFQWVPLAVGIVMTPVALRAASIMALSGPESLTLLYPWVDMVKSTVFQMPADFSTSIADWVMYLQFPVYGLLMSRLLRNRGFWVALGVVALLHVVGIGVAILLAHMENPSLRFF